MIATAVEQQSATTMEMSRNVSAAARGSGAVAKNIAEVAQAAKSTLSGATESQKAAQQLARMSTELRENILGFYQGLNSNLAARATEKEVTSRVKLIEQLDRLKAIPESEQ